MEAPEDGGSSAGDVLIAEADKFGLVVRPVSRSQVKSVVLQNRRLKQDAAITKQAVEQVADSLDTMREAMLSYDAADDRSGEKWDGIRIEFDTALRSARDALREIAK